MGFGAGEWGSSYWGVGADPLRLIRADPIADNKVRLSFNQAVRFTGILDPNDASSRHRYSIAAVENTLANGTTPRAVFPAVPQQTAGGSQIDLITDRHFDGYPGRYLVTVNQLRAISGGLLDPAHTTVEFDGLDAFKLVATPSNQLPNRDIANPQTYLAMLDPLPETDVEVILGSIPIAESGDYAFDHGLVSFKKRVIRRVVSSKKRFAHIPGYGVGIVQEIKRLGSAAKRAELSAESRKQIMQEPECIDCSVDIVPDSTKPGLYRMRIRARTKTSGDVAVDIPLIAT